MGEDLGLEMGGNPDAQAVLDRLRRGNGAYVEADSNPGDISAATVGRLFEQGQAPYACVLSCADSRVVPEHIFMAGLGELFCIRVAGNVVGDMELASALYAADHLGTRLILVMGHTRCGAIEAGMDLARRLESGEPAAAGGDAAEDAIAPLARRVADAIGTERDSRRAAILNVEAGVARLLADPGIARLARAGAVCVRGAVYHADSGAVEFL